MISIDDHPPSDPASSYHQEQHISHDLKVSYLDLKFSDADLNDTNNPLPNFSIRDYVFGIRNKDIACNWPFSSSSLQLCLKHGVKNLLPPFQSIDSLRNNSSLTRCSLENRLTDGEVIKSIDGKSKNDHFKSKEKIALLGSVTSKSSASIGGQESQFHLQRQTKLKEKDKPKKPENTSIRTILKKSRFLTKLNSGVEYVAPNSEIMTSKVCPVCKVFSSSSNTTLNAHIDQCLIGEGTIKWTENPKTVVKHKVKPRKMRLMMEIYKTAPHCTIEELDRRNGTSWATNSSFPAQEFQFQDEEEEEEDEEEEEEEEEEVEKEERMKTTINTGAANKEGDVYIDTDGTKVRILSVSKAGSSDNHGCRKLLKEVKRNKIIMGKKKTNIFKKKHHHKYLKFSSNARKLCLPKFQARSGQEDDVADLGIIRPPRAWSKRTGLSKKFSGENRKVELQCCETKELVVENEKSSSRCDLRTPQSSSDNNWDSSQNRKKMRISLSLIKQRLNGVVKFRKEGTHMHDDDDDDDDDKKDNDDDDGLLDACPSPHSKGSDFSSLTTSLSFPAAKFNLKRGFSAVEKSGLHFNETSDDGQSQDSLKEHSRTEEQITGRSQISNGDTSIGLKAVNRDELHDVESVRNKSLLSNIIPAPSFMGLSASFDPEFSKQECDELYQDQICLINRAPKDVEIRESYCHEVDAIPIPGPPGSFLPASPGGEMVSEEEIPTVTVLSSENQTHHQLDHTIDQDSMSNSPVSIVSNSISTSVQDDRCKKTFFSGDTGFTTEKGSSHNSFKKDHQPCCCSRKEGTLSFQDSYISRKQQFNFKCGMFPSSNYPTSPEPETASFPTHRKFPVSSDCNFPVGSPLKPVLRLMGKNLTVAKSDEDEFRPPQPGQQPVMFSQYQNGFQSQHFNVPPPINMKSPVDSMPIHGGFMTSMDRYVHGGPYPGSSMPQRRSHHGHNVLDIQTISGRNAYTAASGSKPMNEIIIIDDSPESEADDSMLNDFLKRNQRQTNPLYTMYPCGGIGGSTVFRGGSFQTSLGNNGLANGIYDRL